ncbi:MAG: hypothetical protein HFH40_09930 [Lachnospiraceae bacterium]|nr:hypothetical protein [Lachnospiraceae bacterium]
MNLKKLKRLLSLTLTAAMVASMISVPVNAETVTDNTAAAMEEMIADPADEDVADDADGTDTADDVEDVADEKEDSDVADETENSDETEDEGTAEAAEEELFNAREAGDGSTGEGTGDSGTTTTPEGSDVIVVGDDTAAGQFPTLQAAIAEATKEGATRKKIELLKNAELTEGATLTDTGVEIDTKGHSIVIPAGANVTLKDAKITNSVAVKNCTILSQGTLTIVGGEYTTKGGQMFRIEGTANMSGATISCPQEAVTAENNWYDALPIISVHGAKGKLIMTSGTINANVGNGSNCGMYGISVMEGAEVILGEKNADNNALTVNSMFSAIAMNGLTAPGRITVNSGTYNSSVSCTEENEKKFNAVIYLPATANVNINGGVFAATAQNPDAHVIAIPYDKVGVSSVRVNLNITGGIFTSQGTVFNHPYVGSTTKARIAISGGTFSSDLKTELKNTGIAAGYQVYEQTGDAGKKSYTVSTSSIVTVNGVPYNNLQQAITAAKAGTNEVEKTITLGKDLELTDAAYDLEGVIVDTAGHMLTIPEGKGVTLTKGTVKNEDLAEFSGETNKITNSRTMFQVNGSLTINGGTYETKGSHLMRVNGVAEIGGGASFSGTATSAEIANLGNYDGASLIGVTGTDAKLTVKDATINATVGNVANTDGMYGIYVEYGAELVLGEADKVPTITSTLSAVGMNGLTAPGKITINGGTYTSNASVTADNLKKFNAVLYFPASANVTINGGTFVAAGTAGERHVISVPYNIVNGKHVKLNLIINNGTFKVNEEVGATGAIFFDEGMKDQYDEKTANLISVRGGTFVNYEPAYVAGCHSVAHENDSKEWTVSPEENEEHTLTWVAMQEATCWEEGVIGHYECLNCHKMYNKKTTDKIELFAEDVAIPREEHVGNGTHYDAHPATCTKAGNKEYVKCEKCGLCYPDQDALDKDTKGEVGVPESKMIILAKGHTYPKKENEDGSEGGFVIDIDSENLTYKNFVSGEANGVVVTRTCSVCNASEDASTVAVTAKGDNPVINCQEAQTLKYTATASFDKFATDKDGNLTVVEGVEKVTEDFSYDTTAGSHSYDLETVSFNWDDFDIATFKAGEQNGVRATGRCKVCGNNEVEAAVTVTSTDYPTDDSVLDCRKTYHFTATATFGEQEGAPSVNSEVEDFPGVHTLKWKQDYVAPTCLEEGQWGAYECTVCHSFFLGEDSAKVNDSKTEAELVIAKRDHALQLRGFSWTNTDQTEAKATFYCTSCKKTLDVPVNSANIKFNAGESETDTCGVEINQVYDVSVELEKTAVTVGENGEFVYTPTEEGKKTTYSGKLKKKALQPHIFVTKGTDGQSDTPNVVLKWMDNGSADDAVKHDVDQGVKAIITCATCGEHITVASKGGIIDDETSIPEETLVIPYVKLALNETESAKTKATCVAEGTAVYDVTVSYDDGTGMQELDSKSISTKTPVDKNAHAWTALAWKEWVEEEPAKTEDGVRIPPVYSIKATRHCTNKGCETYPGEVLDEDGNSVIKEQAFETVTTVPEDENAPYILVEEDVEQKKTCVQSGITNYEATAYFNGEAVKKVEAPNEVSHPTPAVYNDPVEGHKITLEWNWDPKDSDSEGPVEKLTGLTVKRYCPNCTYSEDPDIQGERWVVPLGEFSVAIGDEMGSYYDSEDPDTWKLRVEKSGEDATCNTPGTARYKATLNYNAENVYNNTRVLVNAALGHTMKWHINWKQDETNGEGTEKWVATAVKKCIRDNEIEVAEAPLKVEYDFEPATCVKDGSEVWTITNLPSTNDDDYVANTEKVKTNPLIRDDNSPHDFTAVATVVWDEKTHENADGEEVLGVTFTRTCQRKGGSSHVQKKTFEAKRVIAEGEKLKPDNCADGYTWNYKVSEEDMKTMTEPQPDATGVKDVAWLLPDNADSHPYVVAPAEGRTNHNLTRVAGGNSNDCTAQVHPTYFECKRCQKRYTSLTATTEYTGPAHEDTKPQGHLYGDPVFSWVEGENGRAVRATFTCMRSGCAVDAAGHSIELAAEFDPSVAFNEIEPECADTKNPAQTTSTGVLLEKGQGFAWGLVTLEITKENATDNLKVGDKWEGDLDFVLNPVDHHFVGGTCEWCDIAEGGVTVISHGRISTTEISKVYYSPEQLEDIALPTPPNQLGYDFKGWSLTENGSVVEGIEDAIRAEADKQTGNKTVHVYAIYEKIVETAVVKVTNACMSKNEAGETVYTTIGTGRSTEVILGERHEEKAVSPLELVNEGTYYFSHWERVDTTEKEDGTSVETVVIVGTDLTCELYIQTKAGVNLRAVYVLDENEAIGKEPSVEMTDIYGSVVGGVNKLSFASTISIPMDSNFEVREVGFLYSVSAKTILSEEEMTIANLGGLREDGTKLPHKQEIIDGTAKTNILTIQIPDAMADRTVYARPYVILRDTKSGQVSEPIYGAIVSKKFNEVAPAQPAAK